MAVIGPSSACDGTAEPGACGVPSAAWRRPDADGDGAGVAFEAFEAGERFEQGRLGGEGRGRVPDQRGADEEVVDAERRGVAGGAAGGEDVGGTGGVIASGLGGVLAEEGRAHRVDVR